MTSVSGKVLNWTNYAPVPGATVSLMTGNLTLKTVAAGNDGVFNISTTGVPDSIVISSVGYETRRFGFAEYSEFWTFFLMPSYKTEGEVVVTATKKTLLVGLIVALLILSQQKR